MGRNAIVGAILALIATGCADVRRTRPSTPAPGVRYPPLPPPPVQPPVAIRRESPAN